MTDPMPFVGGGGGIDAAEVQALIEEHLTAVPSTTDVQNLINQSLSSRPDQTAVQNLITQSLGQSVPALRVAAPAHAGARTKAYDPVRNVYNLTPVNMRKARAALGNAAAGSLEHFAVLGESISENYLGTESGFQPASMWPVLLRARLAEAGVPDAGTVIHTGTFAGLANTDSRITRGGTWSMGGNGVWLTSTTNGSTLTITQTGTQVDVAYLNSSGAFTVTIDGGAPASPNRPGGSSMGHYSVTGLADTAHTVVVTTTSTTAVYIVGMSVYRASGLLINNMANYGMATAPYVSTSSTGIWVTRASSGPSTAFKLAIAMMGGNDLQGDIAPATITANIGTFLDRFAAVGADGMLMLFPRPEPTAFPDSKWFPFVSAMYDLADLRDIPLIDLADRYGSFAQASSVGLMSSDNIHLKKNVQADIARAVRNVLVA